MRERGWIVLIPALLLAAVAWAQAEKPAPAGKEVVLKAEEAGKLFPEKVFFAGKLGTVQARNSGGVRYANDSLVLAALVDSSGYAAGIREKYQAYLIAQVPLEIGGQTLKPGAYGAGFLEGNKFVVMDLGANDVLQANSAKDAEMKRPVPLQVVAGAGGTYRLYHGRDFVEFKHGK